MTSLSLGVRSAAPEGRGSPGQAIRDQPNEPAVPTAKAASCRSTPHLSSARRDRHGSVLQCHLPHHPAIAAMETPDLGEKPARHPEGEAGDRRQTDQQPPDPPFQTTTARRGPGKSHSGNQQQQTPAAGHRKDPPLQHPPNPRPDHLVPIEGAVGGSAVRTCMTFSHRPDSSAPPPHPQATSSKRLFLALGTSKLGTSGKKRPLSCKPDSVPPAFAGLGDHFSPRLRGSPLARNCD